MGTSQNLHRKHSQAFFPSVNFATNSKNTPPSSSLPVSRRDDIVYRGWWWVSGGAQWLTQTVGSCLGEHEPVSDVELGDQTVLHYLVQVIARGTPQAAAEHWSILGCVLLTHRAEIIYLVIKRTTIFINWRWELCDNYSTGEGLSWQITDGHHRKNAWKHWEAQGKKSFALVTSWPTENLRLTLWTDGAAISVSESLLANDPYTPSFMKYWNSGSSLGDGSSDQRDGRQL